MCDFGISETATAAYISAAVAAAAAVASAGIGAYSADQTQKNQANIARQTSDRNAQLEKEATDRENSYRDQQEQYRVSSYDRIKAEQLSQEGRQAEADAILKKSVDAQSQAKQDALNGQESGRIGSLLSGAGADAAATNIPGVSTGAEAAGEAGTRVVADSYKDQLNSVGDYLKGLGQAKGKIAANTSVGVLDNISLGRSNNAIRENKDLASGSANAVQGQINADNLARSILGQAAGENVSLFNDRQANINQNGALAIDAAGRAGDSAKSVGDILNTVSVLGGTLATNHFTGADGSVPIKKAIPVAKMRRRVKIS